MNPSVPASAPKLHPFEAAGLGCGPFRFIGAWSFPSPSLAEQNPSAYQNALASMPRDVKNGCGTCANCGRAIMNVCIVANAAGDRWGVGCDCVLKTGDRCIGDPAKVAVARLEKEKRSAARARREAARYAARMAEVDAVTGETRQQRYDRERAEARAAEDARRAAAVEASMARFGFLLVGLDGAGGGFAQSMAEDIRRGCPPSGRALTICLEIHARRSGRYGSKAYVAAYEEASARLEIH